MLTAALLSTLASALPQDDFVLSGRIVDPDGEPIEGARVDSNFDGIRQRWITDATGEFELRVPANLSRIWETEVLTPDGHGLELGGVQGKYYDSGSKDVIVGAPGTLVGRVIDRQGEVQVAGHAIFLQPESRGALMPKFKRTLHVDPEVGEFRLDDVPPGTYRILVINRATEDRFVTAVTVAPDVEVFVEVLGGSNPGVVLRPFVPHHVGRSVKLVLVGPDDRSYTPLTDPAGTLVFDGLPDGAYRVEQRRPFLFEPIEERVAHDAGEVDLALVPNGRVELTAVFPEGAAPARIGLRGYWEGCGVLPGWDLARGPHTLRLIPGRRRIEVVAAGWPSRLLELEVRPGRNPVEVAFAQLRTLELRLEADPGGARVSEVELAIVRGRGRDRRVESSAVTDAAGRATIRAHPLETCVVELRLAPWLTHQVKLYPRVTGTFDPFIVRAPELGWIEGRIGLPPELDLDAWRVVPAGSTQGAPLEGEGTFRIGPFWPGRTFLDLLGPAGRRVRAGGVTVEPCGAARVDLDLADSFPAFLVASIRVGGEPLEDATLQLTPLGATPGPVQRLPLSAGRATCEVLPPGEYRVLVDPTPSASWTWVDPAPLVVRRAEHVRYARRIELDGD